MTAAHQMPLFDRDPKFDACFEERWRLRQAGKIDSAFHFGPVREVENVCAKSHGISTLKCDGCGSLWQTREAP